MEITQFKQLIDLDLEGLKVISFDFFDTLVWRKRKEGVIIQQCADFFAGQQSEAIDKVFFEEGNFLALVDKAELEARYQTGVDGFDKETAVTDIYKRVFSAIDEQRGSQLAKTFCRILVDAECENLALSEGVISTLQALKNKAKKIIITSDTYYSRQDFDRFINALGLSLYIDDIYLSANVKLNKATGNMYHHILSAESVSHAEILHIGDNRFSDFLKPKALGMRSIEYKPDLRGLETRPKAALYDFGYQFLAPVLYDFMTDVSKKVHADASQPVFMGRDAFLLKQINDIINGSSMPSSYLYINRVISNQVFFDGLDNRVFTYLSAQHKFKGVWGLVTVFGLMESAFSANLARYLEDSAIKPSTVLDEVLFKSLCSNDDIAKTFKSCLSERSEAFAQYLQDSVNAKNIALVDVGWRGEIFRKLEPAFEAVNSMHFFCYDGVSGDGISGNGITGYIDRNSHYFSFINEFKDVVEFCLSEGVASVSYIDNNLKPVHNGLTTDINERAFVQCGVIDRCKELFAAEKRSENDIAKSLDAFCRYLSNTPSEFVDALEHIALESDVLDDGGMLFKDILAKGEGRNSEAYSQNNTKNYQSMIYGFLELVKTLLADEKVVIYGAGSGADFLLPHVVGYCAFIVDLNEKLHGKYLQGIPVKPVKALNGYSGKVVVTVIGRKHQVSNALDGFNIEVVFLEDYL